MPLIYLLILLVLAPTRGEGQNASNGLRLQLEYSTDARPGLVLLAPKALRTDAAGAAEAVKVLHRDLDFSDRYEMIPSVTHVLADTAALLAAGAVWAVQSEFGPDAVTIRIHDLIYGGERTATTYKIPPRSDASWRMALHAISDAIVEVTTGSKGAAASRVVFVREGRNTSELYVVDSDGENMRRLTDHGSWVMSPAWDGQGTHIAYTSFREGAANLYERNLRSGEERLLSARDGINATPAYAAGAKAIAYAASVGGRSSIWVRDASGDREVTPGAHHDAISPSLSPDGREVVYVSNRLGQPHLFMRDLVTGSDRWISSFASGESAYVQAPDWSPLGDRIAFHIRLVEGMQIAAMAADGSTVRVLTRGGRNEDPSWAPDGRHIVYASDRDGGGLFIVDSETGRTRKIVGGPVGLPDWSPHLMRVSQPSTK